MLQVLERAHRVVAAAAEEIVEADVLGSAIESLSIEARNRGYSVVLGHAGQRADEALALTAVLEARQCDAIVLLGDFTDEPRLVRDVRDASMPVVALWHGSHLDSPRWSPPPSSSPSAPSPGTRARRSPPS